MISNRQIQARFRRSHLIMLANELLLKDLELKEGTKKWFTLRGLHTAEDLADCVSYKGMVEKECRTDSQGRHWHSVNAVFKYKQISSRGRVFYPEKKFEIVCNDDWRKDKRDKFILPDWSEKVAMAPYQYQLDYIIMWELFRHCDHVIKDNSAISIFI